jgi:hypothetical protein
MPEGMAEVARGEEGKLAFRAGGNADTSRNGIGEGADAGRFEDYRARYRDDFRRQVAGQLDELHAMVEKLCDHAASAPAHDLPEALFHAFTNLIEAEVDETIARDWLDRLRDVGALRSLEDASLVIRSRSSRTSATWWRSSGRREWAKQRRSRNWRRIIGCARSGAWD